MTMLRRFTRRAVETRAGRRALQMLAPDTVAVFLWHSVGSTAAPFFDRQAMADGVSSHCSLDGFAAHIAWIRERFRIVSLDGAIETVRTGRRGTGWMAALTFDDGFRNVAEEASPWLHARGLPSTIFVNSAMADGGWVKDGDVLEMLAADGSLDRGADAAPFDADALLARRGESRADVARATRAYASWSELRSLPSTVTFGNHGARHVRLSAVPADAAGREIDEGRLALERELGAQPRPYAFAFGQPADITGDARAHALATHTALFSAFGGCTAPDGGAELPRVPVFSTPDSALLAEYTFPPRTLARLVRRA
jgi:peptidoglycan/xylan/chitin deacetylase (PgdA/CDA1 family)